MELGAFLVEILLVLARVVAVVVGVPTAIYVVVRVVAIAYFRSREEYLERMHKRDLTSSSEHEWRY